MKIFINKKLVSLISLVVLLFIALFGVTFITPEIFGNNQTNVSIKTYVNVTNTEPRIYNLVVSPDPVTLSPGNTTKVTCTAYVFDWNGWQDFQNGSNNNATFYDYGSGLYDWASSDDDNYHYTNLSCQDCAPLPGDTDGTNGTCNCSFDIAYYANDTRWMCNFTVADGGGAYWYDPARVRTGISNWTNVSAIIEPMIAINVTHTIDYGELAVTENSSMQPAYLTNIGNVHINVSVEGWGGDNETQGQNLSMICRRANNGQNVANISVGWERYSINDWDLFNDMINLTSDPVGLANYTLPQRLNDTTVIFGDDQNATYWRIYIPLGVTGYCNGTLKFSVQAIQSEGISQFQT